MQASSDDGGSSILTNTFTKTIFLFLFLIPVSVYKQTSSKPFTPPALKESVVDKPADPKKTAVAKKKSRKKKLYITFDDGPNRGTKNVLHIVQDEQVPVSFFIVGEHVFASRTQAQMWDSLKMAKEIDLCNHSYSHAHHRYEKYYESPDSVVKDFRRTHDSLGLDNSIARTPGRNIWRVDTLNYTDLKKSRVAADSLKNAGFVLMGWDLEWHYDAKSMSVSSSAEELIQQIDSLFKYQRLKSPDHLVLLAHDQVYDKSADSLQLRLLLQLLKRKDEYEIALITDYPGAEK